MEKTKKIPCLTQAYEEPVTAAQLGFDLNGSKAGCEGKSKAILDEVLTGFQLWQSAQLSRAWHSRAIQMSWTLGGPSWCELFESCCVRQDRLCCGQGLEHIYLECFVFS